MQRLEDYFFQVEGLQGQNSWNFNIFLGMPEIINIHFSTGDHSASTMPCHSLQYWVVCWWYEYDIWQAMYSSRKLRIVSSAQPLLKYSLTWNLLPQWKSSSMKPTGLWIL